MLGVGKSRDLRCSCIQPIVGKLLTYYRELRIQKIETKAKKYVKHLNISKRRRVLKVGSFGSRLLTKYASACAAWFLNKPRLFAYYMSSTLPDFFNILSVGNPKNLASSNSERT